MLRCPCDNDIKRLLIYLLHYLFHYLLHYVYTAFIASLTAYPSAIVILLYFSSALRFNIFSSTKFAKAVSSKFLSFNSLFPNYSIASTSNSPLSFLLPLYLIASTSFSPFLYLFPLIIPTSFLAFSLGGYGSVFKAWDLLTCTTVAVKLIDLEGKYG
jgi:hypothetical protein